MLFELLEWGTAAAFGGDLGQAYLGTQGDECAAHKDMALASLGALVTMSLTAAINWRLQRDFAWEWVDSFRVKHKAPLGGDEAERMARKKKQSGSESAPGGNLPQARCDSEVATGRFRVSPHG